MVVFEDAVREPVFAHELPDVFDRVAFGRPGRERHECDVVGDFEGQGGVPSGLIEHDDGMGARFNDAADLGEVSVQRLCVGTGHDEALPLFGQMAPKIQAEVVLWSLGADGLVPRFAPRRVILFFLPDAGLVLPPDFDLDTVVQRGFYPGHGGAGRADSLA